MPIPMSIHTSRLHRLPVLCAVLTLPLLSACTTQAWYDGLRQAQRDQCQHAPSADERQACLARNNAPSYDRYEKERNGGR